MKYLHSIFSLCIFIFHCPVDGYISRIITRTNAPCIHHQLPFPIKKHVENQLPSLRIREDILDKSDAYFREVNGYTDLLNAIIIAHKTPNFLKGFLFELEIALALHDRFNECTIECFHYDMYRPESHKRYDKREIDILTHHHAIECKYYNWDAITKNKQFRSNLKRQLCDQHSIIADYNKYHGTRYRHIFASKNAIPNWFKTWLEVHSITYNDTPIWCCN